MQWPRLILPLLAAGLAGCAGGPATAPHPTPPPAPVAAQTADPGPELPELNRARLLQEERKFGAAAELYAELFARHPAHPVLLARQAHMLSLQGDAEADPARARALRKRARELAERSETLGAGDVMAPLLIAAIRPDGTRPGPVKGEFSRHEEVERLIREGEAAFRRDDFAAARVSYQRAAELEPNNYLAHLWTGDAHFSAHEYEPACGWFRKAIAIDPDNETAHRYLGDALRKLGRRDEALNEHIAALLCEPYQRTTRQHFPPALRAGAEAAGYAIPRFPALDLKRKGEKYDLTVNPENGIVMMAYCITCLGWREKEFARVFSREKQPRRSLPEELEAIAAMLEMTGVDRSTLDKDTAAGIDKWKPVLDGLARLKRLGLLEAYVFFERPDAELAQDYAAYRAEHRDKLEQYVRIYWCSFVPPAAP